MNKVRFKKAKAIKVILWVVIISVLIIVISAGLIQIPAVQNKIVQAATSFVSNKTRTKVEIKNVSIKFPKTVVIEGLFLEDTKKDTLIYAGSVKINIALYDLFSGKIAISTVSLKDAVIKLHSTKTDPLFNYNFLITSFAGSTQQGQTDTLQVSKWAFSLDKVYLNNIRFIYNDEYKGINVNVEIQKSEVIVDEIAPKKSLYLFDDLILEGLNLIVQTTEPAVQQANLQNEKKKVLPTIMAQKLQLINSTVTYTDSRNFLSVNTVIDRVKLEKGLVDVQNEQITFDCLNFSESDIRYHTFEPEIVAGSVSPGKSNWKVSVNRIDAESNMFVYKIGDGPEIKNRFDGQHLELTQLTFEATDFYYSSDLTRVSVRKLSAIDQNQFVINSFETDFSMDQYSITTNKLKLKTPNSSIDGDFHVEFTSLPNFTDSLQFSNLNLIIRSMKFKNHDALYFSPALINLPFFTNLTNTTTVSGTVSGPLNNLKGRNLVVRTGKLSVLETDFSIAGLPNVQAASYHFPNLKVISGKNDLEMLAGLTIPESIELPENISLEVVFNGKIRAFESTIGINSSFGAINFDALVDKEENFSSKISVNSFDTGRLLKDTVLYGPVSLTAEAAGQGLDIETVKAAIKGEVTELYFNQYIYRNLSLDGTLSEKEFSGKINLNDENAVFNFEGIAGLNPGLEFYKFKLDLQGADLQKLNITNEDLRIGLAASASFEGGSPDKLNGTVGITNLTVVQGERIYVLDSLLFTSVNKPDKSELNFSSSLIDAKYSGTMSPNAILPELKRFINNYFPLYDDIEVAAESKPSDFSFEIQLHDHPILSQIILPQLNVLQPGIIHGSFDSENNDLKLHASMNKIVYGTTEIAGLVIDVNSDASELVWSVSSSTVSNNQVKLDNFLIEGKLADNTLIAGLTSIDDDQRKKFVIRSKITKTEGNYKLVFNPEDFYLMFNSWDIDPKNYIEFGNEGFLIHNLFINNAVSQIKVASVNQLFNDDLNIELKNFKLDDISRIIEKDTSFVKGIVNGNALLKRVNDTYGIIADAKISGLSVREVPVGDLTIKATNPETGKFDLDVNLSGPDNNLSAVGYFMTGGGDNSISVKTAVRSLSMKTIEAFLSEHISESSGTLSGDLFIQGTISAPDITGDLVFNDVFVNPAVLNNRLHLSNETIQFKPGGIWFSSFTLSDTGQNKATIDGSVQMKKFSDFVFALQVNATDFLLLNTTSRNNKNYYGRMIIDSRISINGPIALPVINGRMRIKRGSNFTFAVPEDRLSTDRGEDVVEFNRPETMSPILYRERKPEAPATGFKGIDLSTIVEIDKQATLRLLMDPSSTDSLVVRGEAALSFSIDRSGKMSLTGAYNLDEGSYLVSLESITKRKFDILPGSTIIWNGDPLDAVISINARYAVKAAPYDLVAFQMSGLTADESGGYKQQYPFWVLLKLRGEILQPVISFEIQLPPEERGILGGAVNQKLSLLNEDESAMNKQVFALLVLGRFIQENPLHTASGGTSTIVRSTVGKFLSAQLNQLTSVIMPGVELNFDIQSYEDYQSGQPEGRTQVDIGLKKQLFDERLSVQLGGSIDVEGKRVRQNQATDIASDIRIEYRLTKDGRYRLKGFRYNQYEGDIEGQLVETGIGFVYVRDFNWWKNLFSRLKKKSDPTKIDKQP